MSKSLAAVLTAQKNEQTTNGPWVLLLYITVGSDYIAVTNNTRDVTFDSITYVPFPFAMGDWSQSTEGSLPELDLTVSNYSRDVHTLLESSSLVGKTVTLRRVNLNHLDDSSYCDASVLYIKSAVEKGEAVTFRLGVGDWFNQPFPRRTFSRFLCQNVYGTNATGHHLGCAVSAGSFASYPTCNKTLAACRVRENVANYGAFPGIPRVFG